MLLYLERERNSNNIMNMKTKKKTIGKLYEQLTFTDDFMFCKVMTNHPELCRELLELILGIKIRELQKIHKQHSIELTNDAKGIRLDVYVEDDENSVYDIEMQAQRKRNLPKRSRYYQGMVDLDLLERSGRYETLKRSFVIFICLEDPFGEGKACYTIRSKCEESRQMMFGGETIKVFLNAQAATDDIPEELAEFLKYLRTGNPGNSFTVRIEEAVEEARKNKRWRSEYMSLQIRLYEEREEGREEGQALALLKAIEDVADNLNVDLKKACELLNTSLDDYLELKRKMVV